MPADQAQFDRAEVPIARIENWIRRAQQWIAQVHGVARSILQLPPGDPARSWAGRFSSPATFARLSGFDVHAPPTIPAADDDVKYAAINDRLTALALVVNPTFLANGPDVRANMMLERLVDIMDTAEISAPLRPAYVEFVRRVRNDEGL